MSHGELQVAAVDEPQLHLWDSGVIRITRHPQALGQLLANAKRLLDTSGTGFSRRADLLRLANWFAEADDETAHRIYAATLRNYPSRHLLLGPDEIDPRIGPTTSWWHSDPVEVPVSLRERGDRSIRGRSSRVPDPAADRQRLIVAAQRESDDRRAVAAELAAAGNLDGRHVCPAARDLLLDRLADLLARQQTEVIDTDLGIAVALQPGRDTVIHSDDGSLTVHGWAINVRPLDIKTETVAR